jgi:hypothetical protein
MQTQVRNATVMDGTTELCKLEIGDSSGPHCLQLAFADGTVFGLLNDHVSKVLSDILKVKSVIVEPFINKQQVVEKISHAKKQSEATVFTSAHIYGYKSIADEIGLKLSTVKVWLQRPDVQQALEIYCNPHAITFEGIDGSQILMDGKTKVDSVNRTDVDSIDILKQNVYAALETSGKNMERLAGNSRLKSKLMM